MAEPFLGQIQLFAFNFAPSGWALCNGQLLSIAQNTALFSLLGTTYGGNGVSTFQLPDLQGRVPVHFGTSPDGNTIIQGDSAGQEGVTLLLSEMPAHTHALSGTSAAANSVKPAAGAALALVHHSAGTTPDFYYAPDTNTRQPINAGSLSPYGLGMEHTNLQPYLTLNWCIALRGVFPSRN